LARFSASVSASVAAKSFHFASASSSVMPEFNAV
jgi:hypothetical protein